MTHCDLNRGAAGVMWFRSVFLYKDALSGTENWEPKYNLNGHSVVPIHIIQLLQK